MSPSEDLTGNKAITLRGLLTDGVALACATAFVYFTTFVYESGYCAHFLIPLSLISPNTSTIMVAGAAIGLIFVSSANLLGFTTPLFRKGKKSTDPIWTVLGICAVSLIVLHKIYEFTWSQLGWILLSLVLFFFVLPIFFFIIVLFIRWLKGKIAPTPEKNFTADKEISKKPRPNSDLWFSFDEFLENFFPQKAVRLFLLSAAVIMLAWTVGNGNATTQKRFLTIKEAPNLVVLRIYGDSFIVAAFNRETHEISDELSLISLSDKKQINLVNENIGPLKARADK